jgi:hypothetical protein
MQEYRYKVLVGVTRVAELFGVRRPVRYEAPIAAGDYDQAIYAPAPNAPSFLEQYIPKEPEQPRLGGAPQETEQPSEIEQQFPSAAKKDE